MCDVKQVPYSTWAFQECQHDPQFRVFWECIWQNKVFGLIIIIVDEYGLMGYIIYHQQNGGVWKWEIPHFMATWIQGTWWYTTKSGGRAYYLQTNPNVSSRIMLFLWASMLVFLAYIDKIEHTETMIKCLKDLEPPTTPGRVWTSSDQAWLKTIGFRRQHHHHGLNVPPQIPMFWSQTGHHWTGRSQTQKIDSECSRSLKYSAKTLS